MSYDPMGHIKISVSNFVKSRQFYGEFFDLIGWHTISNESDGAAWKSPEGFGFWVEPAEIKNHQYKFGAPGLHHFCFKAQSRESVENLYQNFLLRKNIFVFDPPQAYPNYANDYYAVFFSDPDGIKLEYAFYT